MKNTLYVLAIFMLVLAASCGKKSDNTTLNNTTGTVFYTYSSMDTIYGMLGLQPKYGNVDATAGGAVTGNSGTQYVFQPTSFQDGTGTVVTGNVQVTVTEYLKKGDMIFSRVLPVASDGTHMVSGAEILVSATQNGNQLYLVPGASFKATILPAAKLDTAMSFFRGIPNASATNNVVNWQTHDTSVFGAVVYNGDTMTIISDSLRYCNADRFLASPNYQSFKVTILFPGTLSASSFSEIDGFTLYDNYKGVWPLSGLSNGVFSESHVPNIPVHFAVFGLVNGHFYAGVTAATPLTGGNYNVLLTEVAPADFKDQLNSLYP